MNKLHKAAISDIIWRIQDKWGNEVSFIIDHESPTKCNLEVSPACTNSTFDVFEEDEVVRLIRHFDAEYEPVGVAAARLDYYDSDHITIRIHLYAQ